MRERRVVWAVFGGVLLAIALLTYFLRGSARTTIDAPPTQAMSLDAGPAPVASVSAPRIDPIAALKADPAHQMSTAGLRPGEENMTPEERFRAHMAETRSALMKKWRYPLESSPLSGKTDLLLPHHVENTYRGLSGDRNGKVLIEQRQDRLYLSPGQPAIAEIVATADSKPVGIGITRSDLVREAADGGAPPVVGTVTFHDDGVAPDEFPGDGISTGLVTPPADNVPGSLTLFVDVQANGEKGTLNFQFVMTASPPASFTQTARDALEEGSVAFYVGVSVQRPGLYEIVGRVYDAHGGAIAYLRFLDQLTTDSKEVRLLAFGKLLVDEGAVPPLYLRDVEGQRMVLGEYPDRELMTEWLGPYKSATYDAKAFSDAEYDGPEKQQKLNALAQAEKDGLANIQNGGSSATAAPLPALPSPPAAAGSGNH